MRVLIVSVGIITSFAPLVWVKEIAASGGLFLLWQVLPFVLLGRWATRFSQRVTLLTLLVITCATLASQIAIFRSESSTAGIALVFVPVYLSLALLTLLAIQRGARAVRRVAKR